MIQTIIKIIVERQRSIIGPLAVEQANKVSGLKVSGGDQVTVEVTGDPKNLLSQLVGRYEELFGITSVEVCKDAIKEVRPPVSPKDLPPILQ